MYWGTPEQKEMKLRFLREQHEFLRHPGTVVPYLPDQVDLDISNRCNLACITCFHSVDRFIPLPDMAMETFDAVLDQAEGRASTITIGNHGEPFIHPLALDMMRRIKGRGFFLNVINNGTLLTRERGQALIDMGVDRVSFSLDSVDPRIYPQLRKGGTLRKTLGNILRFLAMNLEQGLPVYVNISTVNSDLALESEPDIREFFRDLPVHVVYISDILNFQDSLAIRDQTKFVRRGYDKVEDMDELPVCLNGFDRILIRPNGNVSLCAIDWEGVHVLGNVLDTPYTTLWNNDRARAFRRALLDRDYEAVEKEKTLCSRCDGKWVQEVSLRRQAIQEMLADDLRDTKKERDERILAGDCGRALDAALQWVESLPQA